jgi:hypothetical protein
MKDWMRGFHDQLGRWRPSSLLVLLGCSSISVAFLIIQYMYIDLVERMVVFWSWIQWPRLMLCLSMADVSGCSRWM